MPAGDGDGIARLGVVADIQHSTVTGKDKARYVDTLDRLTTAMERWQREGVVGIAQLGDIIDGGLTAEQSEADLHRVLAILNGSSAFTPPRLLHVVGNHCLVNNPRSSLRSLFYSNPSEKTPAFTSDACYGVSRLEAIPGWAFITLDTTELSVCGGAGGWAEGDPQHAEVQEYLEANPLGSSDVLQDWNGGVTKRQLAFLEEALQGCAAKGERAIVMTHHPLYPETPLVRGHLAWNFEEISQTLQRYPGTVRAVLSGHCHWGAYTKHGGIHYVVLKAMLIHDEENAFSVLKFLKSGDIELDGCGTAQSNILLD
eukprot:TRINITY_DN13390_c0_g1_i1.p1 TRINITY_DN13390_c0_g1~~TRINITY_DN13390_c0_g1_i1.p1  ORF type:complete len:330 (+),score=114.02 TRINITY_DN13390_c0_g1_i1:52-990(+)